MLYVVNILLSFFVVLPQFAHISQTQSSKFKAEHPVCAFINCTHTLILGLNAAFQSSNRLTQKLNWPSKCVVTKQTTSNCVTDYCQLS